MDKTHETELAPHEHDNIDATTMRELEIHEIDAVAGGKVFFGLYVRKLFVVFRPIEQGC